MKTATLQITQAIIDWAVPQNNANCAVALAIKLGDLKDIDRVTANQNMIRFSRKSTGLRYIYRTPQAVKNFIYLFDTPDKTAMPFTLTLKNADLVKTEPVARQKASDVLRRVKGVKEIAEGKRRPHRSLSQRVSSYEDAA